MHRMLAPIWTIIVLGALCLPAGAADDPLELLLGSWEVSVTTLQPGPIQTDYSETYEWVLDGKFLRGQTRRPDGGEDIIIGTHDTRANGYPFWVFSSSGTYLYLAPASWNASTRTLEFKSPPGSDVYYNTVIVFPDARSRHWTLIIKDWKGQVVLQQEGRAVRSGN